MLEIKRLIIQRQQHTLIDLPDWQVSAGEVATIMGPSGSGKSTILRWLLGEPLADFSCQGELWLNGERLDNLPIHQRRVGLMYQQGDLFPHLSVQENLVFALPRGLTKAERSDRVEKALAEVHLLDKAQADPASLSGGERSRIALIRSMLAEPNALLLDEPFSALDTELRAQLRHWTYSQLQTRNIPAIVVTHDPADQGNGPLLRL